MDNPVESGFSSTSVNSAGTPEVKQLDLSQTRKDSKHIPDLSESGPGSNDDLDTSYSGQGQNTMEDMENDREEESDMSWEGTEEEEDEKEALDMEKRYRPGIPIILPQRKFSGARNVETIKDGMVDFVVMTSSKNLMSLLQ